MRRVGQSTILAGNDIAILMDKARDLARQLDGKSIAVEHLELGDKVKEIRELYRFTRGIASEPLVFIINADSFFATTTNEPWQNAFLKLFEEPNPNIYFILTTTEPHKLLPTILSRGQLIRETNPDANDGDTSNWFNLSIYERLRCVATVKTREAGLTLVRSIAGEALRDAQHAKSLKLVSDTLDRLSQNGNVKLQLTNLAVNL